MFLKLHVFIHVLHVCTHMCALGCVYGLEDSLRESALFFYQVSPGDQTQIVKFGSKCLYYLSKLPSSILSVAIETCSGGLSGVCSEGTGLFCSGHRTLCLEGMPCHSLPPQFQISFTLPISISFWPLLSSRFPSCLQVHFFLLLFKPFAFS